MKKEIQPTEEQIKIYRRMSGEKRLRIGLEWSEVARHIYEEGRKQRGNQRSERPSNLRSPTARRK